MLGSLVAAIIATHPVCQTASGYASGYGAQTYVATPYLQNVQARAYQYAAPAYYQKIVTAFVPINQYERTEIVGDQARAQQFAQARLQADTSLAQGLAAVATELKAFKEQVAAATKVQDQAFQVKQQAQYQPPPVAQYPVQPSPQVQSPAPPTKATPDYGQVPEPPVASPQAPAKGFPTLPPVNVPPPPTDAPQDQQGTFPTQSSGPTQPQGFQASPSGPLSPAMQAATQIIGTRCGSCHGPNGSGGRVIMASKDRLASYAPDFLKMLDQVAYRGFVLTEDGRKLKMPPSGRGMSSEEWAQIHAAQDEAEQAATLASNTQGVR